MNTSRIKITAYINEGDQWEHQPLYLALMDMLHQQGIAGGTVLHAVAGFTNKGTVETTSLVDIDGRMPLVVEFVDTAEKIDPIIPLLKKMTGTRLITRENVEVIEY